MSRQSDDLRQLERWIGRRDFEKIRRYLDHGRWRIRRAALRALVDLNALDADEALLAALEDRAGGPRRFAYGQLRDRGDAALPLLAAQLDHPRYAAPCAAILACSAAGREILWPLPDHGSSLLIESLQRPHLPVRIAIAVTKSLVVGGDERVGDALAALLDDESVMLRYAAGRALYARWDPRAVPWAVALLNSQPPDRTMVSWLGEQQDARALPVLRKLASPWRAFFGFVPPAVREAAREAIAAIEASLAHIPAGAISLARGRPDVSETALSLWREGETAEEAAAESDEE